MGLGRQLTESQPEAGVTLALVGAGCGSEALEELALDLGRNAGPGIANE